MDFTEYQGVRAINATAIKAGAISMKHMHAIMTGVQKEQSPAMRWGSLVHSAVLEPDIHLATVAVYDGVKRGKDWEAFKAAAGEREIISESERVKLDAIMQAVKANPDAMRLIDGVAKEVSLQWDSKDYGKAKARLDGLGSAGVLEVKTTSKITPTMFAKQFVGMGYDLQCGWYCEGARISGGLKKMPPCHVIAIESSSPYDVVVYRVPDMAIKVGLANATKIAKAYRTAETLGIFDGVADGVNELVMPSWYGENNVMDAFAEMSAGALFGDESE